VQVRIAPCPDGRKVSYQRRLVKAWSNQRLLVFKSDQFSRTMKLTGDEYSELIASEKSREPQKESPVFRKVQEALCAARISRGDLPQIEKEGEREIKADDSGRQGERKRSQTL
jgi:hypothetical protein